jgi:ABC-type Fe3+ transport system substrate-binding protein
MRKKGLSRRDFLRISGAAGAGALSNAAGAFGVPAFVRQTGDPDFSDPAQVGAALTAEGATVQMSSWGFGGLSASVIPNAFAAYTEAQYGVPVTLIWTGSDVIQSSMTTLPLVGKRIADAGWDVIDKEEDSYLPILVLDWTEPINLPQYMPLLTHLEDVEAPYLFHEPDMAEDGADIYGLAYQGFEWFQGVLRKDKVDVANYADWTDLSRDELTGKGITYPFNDWRGQAVFIGILNSLIKQGIVTGDLWSEDAWTQGITWWKDNMENKVQVYGDIGNDPSKQLLLQSGDAWWGATWGSYTRGLLGTEWNKLDDVLFPFYPSSGLPADRETLRALRGSTHPVAARILINWMVSDEFQNIGWYKESEGAEAVNHWNVTESQYLTAYTGGVTASNRAVSPDWAKPYYPADPGSLILPVDWEWFFPQKQWISDTYAQIVQGN